MRIHLFISAALTFASDRGMEKCLELKSQLVRNEVQLRELAQTQNELHQKFKRDVAKDFEVQSEGLIDELHRNAAIKIAFAKRKLAIKMRAGEESFASLKTQYCIECDAPITQPPVTTYIDCRLCPASKSCQ